MTHDARFQPRKKYPEDHWIRSKNNEKALQSYLEQQSKAYSRIKNAFIIELLGDIHCMRFLDYGCGPGMFLGYAAKAGASLVVGTDIEETTCFFWIFIDPLLFCGNLMIHLTSRSFAGRMPVEYDVYVYKLCLF